MFPVLTPRFPKEYDRTDFAARVGPWAVVTGASSGIGEAFARQLAVKGIPVVLIARRDDHLRKLAGDRHPVITRIVPADLAAGC